MRARAVAWMATRRVVANVGANLIGGLWNGVLIVLATPQLVRLLDYEGYGFVSFWLVIQVVLGFFDLGLGPTLIREFADESAQARARRGNLLRTLEWLYAGVACAVTLVLFFGADLIASDWLLLERLGSEEAGNAIRWMAIALGVQYPSALYLSGLSGLQRHGRMNGLQMLGNSLRYIGGVAVLMMWPEPGAFFMWQAFVAMLQTAVSHVSVWRLLRADVASATHPRFDAAQLQRLWRFSAGMATTMVLSVLLANADRVFLSGRLPTAELGRYALAFTATGLLQLGIQPFYRAYFPRFAELFARGDEAGLRREYFRGCRVMAAVLLPAAIVGWTFAPELFRAWVGEADPTTVRAFRWLLVGIGSAGLMWLPAAYQQARGWTSLHVTMIGAALVIGVPAMYLATARWGTVGATALWVIHGVSDLTIGLALMHASVLRGDAWLWVRTVVLPPALVSLMVAAACRVASGSPDRWPGLLLATFAGTLALVPSLTFAVRQRAVHG